MLKKKIKSLQVRRELTDQLSAFFYDLKRYHKIAAFYETSRDWNKIFIAKKS